MVSCVWTVAAIGLQSAAGEPLWVKCPKPSLAADAAYRQEPIGHVHGQEAILPRLAPQASVAYAAGS